MKQLPNILTLGNLFCGALAILCTLQSPAFVASFANEQYLVTAPPPIYWAAVFIGIAAVLDFLDGFVARLLRVQSPIGAQLDSLADVITFGLAPGMILYALLQQAYLQRPDAMDLSVVRLLPALLIPCFAAYRLARFNVDSRRQDLFYGVPTPAVGLFIGSFPLLQFYGPGFMAHWLAQPWVLYLLILLLCFLMVCNLPFFSLKVKNLSWKANSLLYVLAGLTLISIPFLHWGAVAVCFFLYVLLSLGRFWRTPA